MDWQVVIGLKVQYQLGKDINIINHNFPKFPFDKKPHNDKNQ